MNNDVEFIRQFPAHDNELDIDITLFEFKLPGDARVCVSDQCQPVPPGDRARVYSEDGKYGAQSIPGAGHRKLLAMRDAAIAASKPDPHQWRKDLAATKAETVQVKVTAAKARDAKRTAIRLAEMQGRLIWAEGELQRIASARAHLDAETGRITAIKERTQLLIDALNL